MDDQSKNHAKFLILYHLIFVCKYRKKLLISSGNEVKQLFEEIAARSDYSFETLEVDQDHIHCLVKSEPRISPLAMVRKLKQESTILPYSMLEYLTRQYSGVTVTCKIVLFTSTLRTAWFSRSKGIRNKADVVPVLQCFSTSHYRALPTMQSALTAGDEYGWRIPGTSGTGYVGGTRQSS